MLSNEMAYPICLYVAGAGMFRYQPLEHSIELLADGDLRDDLMRAGLSQGAIWSASALFVISANSKRASEAAGARGQRYPFIEAGHAGQNILLQATALGLGAVPMGEIGAPPIRRSFHAVPRGAGS